MKQNQFPLRMYVDDDYRENTLKGINFRDLAEDQNREMQKQNMELGIEWC